jgi:hypothetical protein
MGSKAFKSNATSFVVVATGDDDQVAVVHDVDESVGVVDTARPEARQVLP